MTSCCYICMVIVAHILMLMFVAVVAEVPATREHYHLLGNAVQAAGQVARQVTNTFVRSAADCNVFPDKSKQQRNFTLAEVRQCTGQDGGCVYVVFNGQVLDLTEFASFHWGGYNMLQQHAGQDATVAMRAAGMPAAVFDICLRRFAVGRLVESATVSAPVSAPTRSPAAI